MRNMPAGVALSVFCGVYLAGCCLLTWSDPARAAILAVAVEAIGGSVAMLALPWRAILSAPRVRDRLFLCWSIVPIALITLVTALDGGVGSPLSALFFLPPAFAALSYPLRSMVVVAVMDLAAYVGTAIALGGTSDGQVAVVALTLTAAGWMCAWQAREHDRQRARSSRASRAPTRSPAR
jgi:hypothetical protein